MNTETDKRIDVCDEVGALVVKAAQAQKSEDALRFSQAACNAANAMACVNGTIAINGLNADNTA